ncbi:unnamed protein product [Polarella glacialis]|uniref:Uncharacterized protein n=1 Tax=Polarella glacialis TaxID=89957 RepID=A0A813JYG8_POLGL|nr:unnamed protein product [Polarella glacialis]
MLSRHCSRSASASTWHPFQDLEGEGDPPWSALTSLLHPEANSLEPCEYMDSTAGFAAGLAAVSGTLGTNAANATVLPGAMMGLDLNHDGHDLIVAGAEHDAAHGFHQARYASPPRVSTVLHGNCASGQYHQFQEPEQYCGQPSWGGQRPREPELSAEVASLRHALDQCVRAIETCARAIDSMCAENGFAPSPRGGDSQGSWRSAAAALHDAAQLGQKALYTTSTDPGYGAIAPSANIHQQFLAHNNNNSNNNKRPAPVTRRTSVGPGGGGVLSASGRHLPVGVTMASTGPFSATAPAQSGSAAFGSCDSSRRFLVAAPETGPYFPPGSHPVQFGGMPCAPTIATTPQSLPGMMHPHHHQYQQHLGVGMMPAGPGWGGMPHPGYPGHPGHPGHLAPPANLLGAYPGISLAGMHGLGVMSPPQGGLMSPLGPPHSARGSYGGCPVGPGTWDSSSRQHGKLMLQHYTLGKKLGQNAELIISIVTLRFSC